MPALWPLLTALGLGVFALGHLPLGGHGPVVAFIVAAVLLFVAAVLSVPGLAA